MRAWRAGDGTPQRVALALLVWAGLPELGSAQTPGEGDVAAATASEVTEAATASEATAAEPAARAQQPERDGAPAALALVIETDLDDIALRAAIAQRLERPLTTLSRAQAEPHGASAVLTVSVDPEAGISVMLWQRGLGTELLSAPAGNDPTETINVAAALAANLVEQQQPGQRAALHLEANPYLRKLLKAPPPRPHISPINPYYRSPSYRSPRRPGGSG